jgi:hypothetical protein
MGFRLGFLWSAVNLSASCKQRGGEVTVFVTIDLESTSRYFWGSYPVMLVCISFEMLIVKAGVSMSRIAMTVV